MPIPSAAGGRSRRRVLVGLSRDARAEIRERARSDRRPRVYRRTSVGRGLVIPSIRGNGRVEYPALLVQPLHQRGSNHGQIPGGHGLR
jgi:hypothetical protein